MRKLKRFLAAALAAGLVLAGGGVVLLCGWILKRRS